jgi:nucleotide-binding universal stress UspA family protein
MERSRHVVVGLDGSPGSARALAWAAAHTEVFGPIQPVAAWHYPWWAVAPPAPGLTLPPPQEHLHAAHKQLIEELIEGQGTKIDRLETLTVHGAPGPALVEAAEGASLLVVGTRGRGAIASRLLGSVSLHCVHHAPVPVAVIPPDAPIDPFARVVVGVDGSKSSIEALRWALEHTTKNTHIEAIHAWEIGANTVAEVERIAVEHLQSMAVDLVTDAVTAARSQATQPDREIEVIARRGDARAVMRAASSDADLLVVGDRGHHGLAHLLLGSVATTLVHDPTTPTVVVRCTTPHDADQPSG